MNIKQRAFLDRVLVELNQGGFQPMSLLDLAQAVKAPPQAVRAVLLLGIQEAELHEALPGLYVSEASLCAIVPQLLTACGESPLTPAQFRAVSGLSRRLADSVLMLLEQEHHVVKVHGGWRPVRLEEASGSEAAS